MMIGLVALLLGACGGEQRIDPRGTVRGPQGKADLAGTCQGACGTQSPDGCWCDDQCQLYGDCCTDRDQVCNAQPTPTCSATGPLDALCGTVCESGYQVVGGQVMCTCCTPKFCGGIAGISCPEGFTCKLEGTYPDAGGTCVVQQQDSCFGAWLDQNGNCRGPADGVLPNSCCAGQFCGGIAGIPCPGGYKCKLDGDYPDAGGTCVACQPVLCELYCEHGFAVDENGCEVCKCQQPQRQVASGMCVKNTFDACNSDADCVAGGCGGELCYNPALGGGVSTCECTQPAGVSCGCVNNKCAWWK
jgi:hypothetical protein